MYINEGRRRMFPVFLQVSLCKEFEQLIPYGVCFFIYIFHIFVRLGVEPRTLHILVKYSKFPLTSNKTFNGPDSLCDKVRADVHSFLQSRSFLPALTSLSYFQIHLCLTPKMWVTFWPLQALTKNFFSFLFFSQAYRNCFYN